jgi:RNA polymerase sigma-70 factor (ECF subfamily)
MRDRDALENNPHISRSALEAMHDQLFGWALSRCDFDRTAAEDLMQQAYVELLSGSARFDKRSSLKTFVFAVVQNLARSRFRRLASRLRMVSRYEQEPPVAQADTGFVESQGHVWQAVHRLPQRQRDVIELVCCRDLTVEEASAVMGVSVGTGRVHYDRAKKALKNDLERFAEQSE